MADEQNGPENALDFLSRYFTQPQFQQFPFRRPQPNPDAARTALDVASTVLLGSDVDSPHGPSSGILPMMGTVTGPGAKMFLSKLPGRLSSFLQKMPENLRVNAWSNKLPEDVPAYFSPERSRLGTIRWNEMTPEYATHEALHALAYRKNYPNVGPTATERQRLMQSELPGTTTPEGAAHQIAVRMLQKYPELFDFGQLYRASGYPSRQIIDEIATEGMKQNALQRMPF